MDHSLIENVRVYAAEGKEVPLLTLIRISTACNSRCFMCDSWKKPVRSLGQQYLQRLIDELYDLGCSEIRFTGGEPTYDNHFLPLAKHAISKGLQLSVITNGYFAKSLGTNIAKLGIKRVFLSLDAPYARVHNRLRNNPKLFQSAIENACTMRDESLREGKIIPVTINTVVSRYTIEYLPHMAKVCEKIGADELNLIPIKGVLSAVPTESQIRWYNSELVPELLSKLSSSGVRLRHGNPYIFGRGYVRIKSSAQGNYTGDIYKRAPCSVARYSAFVDELGNVYPCSNSPYMGNEFCIGNVIENTFSQVWFGQRAQNLRDSLQKGRANKCSGCDYTNVCANLLLFGSGAPPSPQS